MKLSDYIAQLQAIQAEHGPDVEVLVEHDTGQGHYYNTSAETFTVQRCFAEDDMWLDVADWRPSWHYVLPPESEWRTCVLLGPRPQD